MTKIKHNFSEGHNKDVKDTAPEWMESFFNKGIEKKEKVIINDLYSNSTTQPKKCSMCGKILTPLQINICSNCIKLKNK